MKIKIITTAIILFMVLGCSLINGPSKQIKTEFEDYSYPLAVGNVWTYEKTVTYSNVVPDSNKHLFQDILLDTILIEAVRLDTLEDTLEVLYLLRARYDSLHNIDYEGHVTPFLNTDSGLFIMSIRGGGSAFPTSDILPQYDYDKKLNKSEIYSNKSASNNNMTVLEYPINYSSFWTYFDKSIFSIYKEVLRFENVKTKAGSYQCFVTKLFYYKNDNEVIDYYSEIGLMKRKANYNDRHYITNSHSTSFDVQEEYTLIEFTQAQ